MTDGICFIGGGGWEETVWELPASHGNAVGKGFQAQGTASVKKGPEAGPFLVCLGNMEEASVSGTEEGEEEEEVRAAPFLGRSCRAFWEREMVQ